MRKHHLLAFVAVCLLVSQVAVAHPHFSKSVGAKTQTMEINVSYFTLPYNESLLSQVKEGFVFITGGAKFNLAKGGLMVNGQAIEAGEYVLRAVATSLDDWTLALLPADQASGANPDMSKAIKLPSMTHTGQPSQHHLTIDMTGGHGDWDGKLVISVSFGPRTVVAAVDLAS